MVDKSVRLPMPRAITRARAWTQTLAVPALLCATLVAVPTTATAQHTVATSAAVDPKGIRRVTVHVDNATVRAAVDVISREAGLKPMYNVAIIPATARVTLHADDMPVTDAFHRVLEGTGLVAQVQVTGNVLIVPSAEQASGIIAGKVIDAGSKRPVRGATVVLDDASRGVLTDEQGLFRLASVNAGAHRVTVRMLGYVRQTQSVTVAESQTVTLDYSLEASVNALDQVIVTGTAVATEQRAVPNAINVITAKDIEQRGITRIDQLFRGDVPGLFAMNKGSSTMLGEVTMFSRGATSVSAINTAAKISNYTNPIKTYVDGVEMADAQYLSQIDPRSIERIEIITGPQASTIYGSNAINGVMQIFTKRGFTPRPRTTLALMSGFIENSFNNSMTPQHDYSGQVTGTDGRWSYNVGGAWNYQGRWTPVLQQSVVSGYGGTKVQFGALALDGSLRIAQTRNREQGSTTEWVDIRRQTGLYARTSTDWLSSPAVDLLNGQTLGLTITYAPRPWWTHQATVGSDLSDTEYQQKQAVYRDPSDSTLQISQSHSGRQSYSYNTTVQAPLGSFSRLTLTLGADGTRSMSSMMFVNTQRFTGSIIGTPYWTRQPARNSGGFLQGQLAMADLVFLTYGLRAEWNPLYGDDAQPNLSPRYGISMSRDLGDLTMKLRGSYGRSTRPPAVGSKLATPVTSGNNYLYYGFYNSRLANPDLEPEYQQGMEAGFELYYGALGSLVVTRYNQTVDNLIASVSPVDSIRTLLPNPPSGNYNRLDEDGYGWRYLSQNLNVASLRNQGWELQGTLNFGPISTRGVYSWTKSRVIGVAPQFKTRLTSSTYQPDASFRWIPEHTWSIGMTYARAASTVALNINGTGMLLRNDGELDYDIYYLRLSTVRPRTNLPLWYGFMGKGYAMADLNVAHRFSPRIEGIVQVQNLTDFYRNDNQPSYAVIGRQSKGGLRITW